jgi:lariat debranching enzyme
VDIVVSHDWPTGITDYGDTETMLRLKDKTGQMTREIQSGQLGNPFTMELLKVLKPKFWFAGHMHIKYTAIYKHDDGVSITRFLALDKCIPRRPFLQLVGIESGTGNVSQLRHDGVGDNIGSTTVKLDPEWMAILKVNNGSIPAGSKSNQPLRRPTDEEVKNVTELISNATCGTKEFPYFGQVHPGDSKYRQWICQVLEMSDRIAENDTIEFPSYLPEDTNVGPPKSGEPPASAGDDALFFFD